MEDRIVQNNKGRQRQQLDFKKVILIGLWLVLLIVCFLNKDKITIQNIVDMSPSNTILAILAVWFLFALKSISVVIYSGILYAASGLIFPLYLAIPVSLIGTAIMITIPFLIGRRVGNGKASALMEKYPKLKSIHQIRSENDFFFSFLLRIAGRLPSDPVSMYMGATDTRYPQYLFGSLLGMSPGAIAITIMGTSITDITSPLFIAAIIAEVAITVISVTVFALCIKRKLKAQKEN